MKIRNILSLLISTFILSLIFFNKAYALFQQVQGIEDAQIKRISLSSLNPNLIYIASRNSLFKSDDAGKSFAKIYVFKDEEITHLFFDLYQANTLYLATERNLYQISDRKINLFSSPEETKILSIGKFKGKIYVGTTNGIYSANQDILNWKKLGKLGDGASIYYIEGNKEELWLATSRGVYVLRESEKFQRVFTTREAEEGQEQGLTATFIRKDLWNKDKIWLGTSQGLFSSDDKGNHWEKMYLAGIDNLSINCLAQTKLERNTLYLGTDKGFFKINLAKKTAQQIFEGLSSSNISWIEFSPKGEIYLATSKGLFRANYFTPSYETGSFEEILKKEPSITEIQQASLNYNEVHPGKIKKWRKALKFRALFPSVTVDYDKTITYDSGSDKYFVGPRDWGLNLKWDVADLIWDTYQDDIDTRSRLNTQLRLDILDEINRVYFERLRIKREITNSSLSKEELFKKNMRLAELTAILDGYTGGYFSRRLKELNQ